MLRLISIITILIFISCNNQSDTKDNSVKQQHNPKNTFSTCFAGIDTLKAGQSIGCSNGTYKLINDSYVIRILSGFPVQFDSCYALTFNGVNTGHLIELSIFDNKDANLSNICTDIEILNNPKPTRKLHALSGELTIGFSDPTILYGNKTHHTTILIENLVFIDNKTGEKIEIKNELLWKVLDAGTPG